MPYGPFDTLAETRAEVVHERLRGSDALVLACAEAGVRLGRFDKRVVEELGQLESETVWVLASIIRRAGAAES
jgi:hypothetical protein